MTKDALPSSFRVSLPQQQRAESYTFHIIRVNVSGSLSLLACVLLFFFFFLPMTAPLYIGRTCLVAWDHSSRYLWLLLSGGSCIVVIERFKHITEAFDC